MASLQKPSLYFYLGLVVIITGFVCLRTPPVDGVWTLTIAPVMLVLGFVVLVPYGLWPRSRRNSPRPDYPADSKAVMITNLTGLGVFVCALTVYLLTLWPGPGWWGSGEYISGCYTLGVTGPPGSLLLQLLGRLASFFAVVTSPAVRINGLIAVVSALSITVFYFTCHRILQSFGQSGKLPIRPVVIGAVMAALTLAFAESVWRHATFTNPYALSLLAASLMIYLAVRWWENPEVAGAGNFLLLIAFLLGLDMSVHRSTLLLAPAFLLMVVLRRPKAFLSIRLWAGGMLLFLLGLSLQLTIMFRAQLGPEINMGNPDSLQGLWEYLTLSQYGIKTFGSDLLQRKGPFWESQIKHEYLRYFGWNFIGMDSNGVGVQWSGLYGIPLLAGVIGLVYNLIRRTKQTLFLLGMFLCASFIAIVYLNVPANFFRDMDRHYLTSFMLFSIWIGIGSYAALRLVSHVFANRSAVVWILTAVLFLVLPANVFLANWSKNNQSSNHTSYNYGHNLLTTCESDAILITAGDSDTFLLWYLQMVEGIRLDVNVLNLSLLNTSWFLRTTMFYHPDLPWTLTVDSLRDLNIIQWETDTVLIKGSDSDSIGLTVVVEPTIDDKYLLIRDQVLLNILRQNRFNRPIYFTSGFGRSLPLGLKEHSRLDGLAWRIVPRVEQRSDYQRLEDNLLHGYDYEGFGEQAFLDRTGKNMTSMYYAAFAHLAEFYRQKGEAEKLDSLEAKFDDLWPDAGGRDACMEEN